ncbi:LacI family DNA-binding transcriptional regulator [Thioclava sp. GXIMD4215]|uniref:LacI family DNA-binding transcriptional regulator n=1 Tax=Thioclava sp. GXIMD4215 TaxID=3131928 RepID=UPI00325106DA
MALLWPCLPPRGAPLAACHGIGPCGEAVAQAEVRKRGHMVSIKDIARQAGTSVSTVSRALNHSGYVSQEVRARVEQAARALNYQPNAGARTLRSGRSNLIGVMLPSLEVEFFARLAHRIEQCLFQQGYQALICSTAEDPAREKAYVDTFAAKQVDGLLVAAIGAGPEGLQALADTGIPIVAIDRHAQGAPVLTIGSDHKMGGGLAARHLLALGHREVVILGAPSHSEPIRLRAQGMIEAFEAEGLAPPALVLGETHNVRSCEALAFGLLSQAARPSAILATSDIAAVAAMRAAKRLGLELPEDLSVTGFDDNPMARCVWPDLTTIRQPVDEIARQSVDNLLARIKAVDHGGAEEITLDVTLIERHSTAPLRSG